VGWAREGDGGHKYGFSQKLIDGVIYIFPLSKLSVSIRSSTETSFQVKNTELQFGIKKKEKEKEKKQTSATLFP
jgi:hypothetical protein